MSDNDLRELERRAKAGDVAAAARLVLENGRAFGSLCDHWRTSRRLWIGRGRQRFDSFCLYCGMNTDLVVAGSPPVFWVDCGGREVEILKQAERDRLARLAVAACEERARREEQEREEIARLKREHEWLRDVPDDLVLDRYYEASFPEMPW